MMSLFHDYVANTEKKLFYVKNYMKNFKKAYLQVEADQASMTRDSMAENPLQAYHLVKRMSVEWQWLEEAMQIDDWEPVLELMESEEDILPNEDDFRGAAQSLVRLADTYRLDVANMSRGFIQELESGIGLTARDLLYLGKQARKIGYYTDSINFLTYAMKLARDENQSTVGIREIEKYLKSVVEEHDALFGIDEHTWKNYYTMHRRIGHLDWKTTEFSIPRYKPPIGPHLAFQENKALFKALCRGEEETLDIKQKSKLICRLDDQGNPYLVLQPLKIEQLCWNPYMAQYHDLITENDIRVLKNIAEPKLSRSSIYSFSERSVETNSILRTSHQTWLYSEDDRKILQLSKLVETVTGLSTDMNKFHSEPLQVANYGIGGHFEIHHDYLFAQKSPAEIEKFAPKQREAGDRMATMMFYLSDVEKGGHTVFPKLRIAVAPKKRSAIFWYNLKKNGDGDELSLHGGCPVLHGSKWIANFWMREAGQTFRRKCDLNPDL